MKKRMISLLVLLFVILLISVAFSLHVLAEAVVSNVVFEHEWEWCCQCYVKSCA